MNFNPMDVLKNIASIKEQANVVQEQLKGLSATGSAGGNIVKVTVSGQFEMLAVELDPVAVDPRDIPMLQDLIVAAHHDAQRKIQSLIKERLGPAVSQFLSGMEG
jgi:DNA-binding YbaB/EbfC family protein